MISWYQSDLLCGKKDQNFQKGRNELTHLVEGCHGECPEFLSIAFGYQGVTSLIETAPPLRTTI